jgi:hypothetical protein
MVNEANETDHAVPVDVLVKEPLNTKLMFEHTR